MLNILVGKFVLEANENVPKLCDLENVELKFGKDIYDVLQLGDYINDKALNLIHNGFFCNYCKLVYLCRLTFKIN